MKILLQVLLRVSLLCLIILGTYSEASATHNLGCTITYECLGNNQYRFTMICYGDCAPGSAALSASATLNFTSSTPGCNASPTLRLDTIGNLSNVDVSQLCDPTTSTCQGGTQPGVEQFYYTGVTTLPAGCVWTATYGTCCRSGAITNLQNPSGAGTLVSTTINTNVVPCNNSVQFTNVPIIYTCDSVLTFYNHGAFDVDGDTLVFSLTDPLDDPAPGTAIPFAGGATRTTPVNVVPGTTFDFDSTTGQMTFRPTDNAGQICMATIKVEEIRNGIVIATTIREVQIVVLTNCNNDPPAVDSNGVQGTALTINGTNLELCRGTFGSFDLVIQDPNGDSLSVSSNIVTAIPGAVVSYFLDTTRPDSVVLTFTVNSINLTPGIYPFTITINDNACPVPSLQFLGYALKVYGSNYTNNIYCRNDNDPIPIIVGDSSGIFRQLLTNPPGLVIDSITGIIDLDSSQLGTFDIVYTLDSIAICPSDSIQITIVDIPDPSFNYPMPLWCRQGVDAAPIITGTPGGLFRSGPGLSINPISGVVDVSASALGLHTIYYDVVGGTCAAVDSFVIDIMELNVFGADETRFFICGNEIDTFQLSSTVSYNGTVPPIQNYSWTPNTNINNTTIPNPQIILLNPDTYVLTYNDSICPTQTDTVTIEAPYPVNILPTSNVVLCNGNSAQIGAGIAPGPGDQTFTYAGPTVVPTENRTTFDLNVSGVAPSGVNAALLSKLSVCFDININSLGLITVILEAPSGEQAILSNRNGLVNNTLNGATFSIDPSNVPITSLSPIPPIAPNRTYLPQGGVNGFNTLLGAAANGTWKLIVIHNNGGLSAGSGNLLDWCLTFGDLSPASFVWTPNNATISCSACDSPVVSPAVNTTYNVVATNLFGCRDTASVDVVIDTALPSPITTCGTTTNSSVTFNWIPVFGASGYSVSIDGGLPQNIPAAQDSFQVTGLILNQCVTMVIIPLSGNTCADGAPDTIICCASGCSTIDPIVITPNGPTTFCPGQSVDLDAGAGFTTYLWSTGAATQVITATTAGTFSVTTTDINGCLDTGSIAINLAPGLTPTITPSGTTILCAGDSIDLDAGAFAGYLWSTGAVTQTIRVGATDAYSVTVNDAGGCIGFDTLSVTVGTPLTVNLGVQDLSCNNMLTPDGRLVATALGSFRKLCLQLVSSRQQQRYLSGCCFRHLLCHRNRRPRL